MTLRANLRKMKMELKIVFDENKMREIVAEAVEKLKAEGYIWRDKPNANE